MLSDAFATVLSLIAAFQTSSWFMVVLKFFPFVLLLEFPLYLITLCGMISYGLRELRHVEKPRRYPKVSCIITCYSEGDDVAITISSLANQIYPGDIEIIPVIDGAIQNRNTLEAAQRECQRWRHLPKRRLIPLPKWQRGGRVSSLNTGLTMTTGEIIMALDGDTSFDNDMVMNATRHFEDPRVAGVAGNLRVRNARSSLAAKMQGLEYVLSISAGKTGLSEFNLVNNISGAFGIFRGSLIRHMGGWDAGTAEDLDMTLRLKQYFGRYHGMRIVFEPHAIGHTDVPNTWRGFFKQRTRWDGDLFYIYIRKYRFNIRPSLYGWRNFFFVLLSGLLVQLLLPYMILFSTIWMFCALPPYLVLGILSLVYSGYSLALLGHYLIYLVGVSERPKQDLGYLPYLPLFPLFGFINRIHNAYSIMLEILTSSHLDTSMAPKWVLKKTKF